MAYYLHDDLMKRCTGKYKSVFRRQPAQYSKSVAKQWKEETRGNESSRKARQGKENAVEKESKRAQKRIKSPKFGGGYDRKKHPKIRIAMKKIYSGIGIEPFYERTGYASKKKPMKRAFFYQYTNQKDIGKEITEYLEEQGIEAKVNQNNNIIVMEFSLN